MCTRKREIKMISVTRLSIFNPKDMEAERIDADHFKCPECGYSVTIAYYEDSRGKHSAYPLKCDKCGAEYGINLVM